MKSTVYKTAILWFALSALFPRGSLADTIYFKNGARLDVKKIWREGKSVKCRLYGDTVSYPLGTIARIEKSPLPGEPASAHDGAVPQQSLSRADTKNRVPADAARLHKKALDCADRGEWRSAISRELRALGHAPEAPVIRTTLAVLYNGLALKLHKKGEHEEALEQLSIARHYDPESPSIKRNTAAIYLNMASEAIQAKDYRTAEMFLDDAARFDSRNPNLHLNRAHIFYHRNEYSEARSSLRRALSTDPDNTAARQFLRRLRSDSRVEAGFSSEDEGEFIITCKESAERDIPEMVASILQDAYHSAGSAFDIYPESPVQVIIYPPQDRDSSGYFADWSPGVYDGKIRLSEDLFDRPLRLKKTIFHEYTHVLVHIAGGARVPLWLNEGLAEYMSRSYQKPSGRRSRTRLLARAAKQKALYPLSHIAGLDMAALTRASPESVALVYAESESFTTYLIERFSLQDVLLLLQHVKSGLTIADSVETQLRDELSDLEKDWQRELSGDE